MTQRRSELAGLRNIGPTSEQWLNDIGIYTRAELAEVGAVAAYQRISILGHNTSLNLLYALHGALTDTPISQLSAETRAALKRAAGRG